MFIMRGRTLGVAAGLVFGILCSSVAARAETVFATDQAADEARFVDLINAERTKAGLAPLSVVPELVNVGRNWSSTMLGKSGSSDPCNVSHNPEFSAKVTADWRRLGENVGCGNVDAAYLHQRFVDSPPHLRNILDPSFDSIGVGIVYDGDVMFVTEQFMDLRDLPAASIPSALPLGAKAATNVRRSPNRSTKKTRKS